MLTQTKYDSPLGTLLLTADENALLTVQFTDLSAGFLDEASPILAEAATWLDCYFSGKEPPQMPLLRPEGTPFQRLIWELMQKIPYGCTTSYGMLAKQAAIVMGKSRMSAQAVGGAIRRNPIAIFIPCHRVVGSDGNLTGFYGGIQRKIDLLQTEGIDITQFTLPDSNRPAHA